VPIVPLAKGPIRNRVRVRTEKTSFSFQKRILIKLFFLTFLLLTRHLKPSLDREHSPGVKQGEFGVLFPGSKKPQKKQSTAASLTGHCRSSPGSALVASLQLLRAPGRGTGAARPTASHAPHRHDTPQSRGALRCRWSRLFLKGCLRVDLQPSDVGDAGRARTGRRLGHWSACEGEA
jgi:hypothetical protein